MTDSSAPVTTLPSSAVERKKIPLASGLIDYFPNALIAVAKCSQAGNDQHHPDKPLHWDKSKSSDHDDCLMRHFIQRDEIDDDNILHRAKVAWRALAGLEEALTRQEVAATTPSSGPTISWLTGKLGS